MAGMVVRKCWPCRRGWLLNGGVNISRLYAEWFVGWLSIQKSVPAILRVAELLVFAFGDRTLG